VYFLNFFFPSLKLTKTNPFSFQEGEDDQPCICGSVGLTAYNGIEVLITKILSLLKPCTVFPRLGRCYETGRTWTVYYL